MKDSTLNMRINIFQLEVKNSHWQKYLIKKRV